MEKIIDMGKKKKSDFLASGDMNSTMKELLMVSLAQMGVTPNEYAQYLLTHKEELEELSAFMESQEKKESQKKSKNKELPAKSVDGNRTLLLKIQMQGVTKPPVWREVTIPSNFNFTQLHRAIQVVFCLSDSHLWQFGRRAYDVDLQIGLDIEDNEFTDDADKTYVTEYLSEVGDKLVYVYDFGDDWTFDVKVQKVMEEPCEFPRLTNWKGDLQPMEDSGGVYAYVDFRKFQENSKIWTKKQKKAFAEKLGFEDLEDLEMQIEDSILDKDWIAEDLAEIK
jgi:hypothetical protein